jgi:hypothetical protein
MTASGHVPTFSAPLWKVWNAPGNRRSGAMVGNLRIPDLAGLVDLIVAQTEIGCAHVVV